MPPADRDSSRAWGGGSLVSEQPGQKWRLSSPGESLSSGMRVAWRGTHCQGAGVLLLGAGRPLMASALGPVAGSPAALRALLRDTGGERRPAALLWGQTPRSSAETALRAGGACGLRAAPDAPDARRVQGAGRRGAHSPKRWGALHSPGFWPETSALILAVYARGLCSTKDVSQRTCHVKGGSAGGGVATGQRGRGASAGEEPAPRAAAAASEDVGGRGGAPTARDWCPYKNRDLGHGHRENGRRVSGGCGREPASPQMWGGARRSRPGASAGRPGTPRPGRRRTPSTRCTMPTAWRSLPPPQDPNSGPDRPLPGERDDV